MLELKEGIFYYCSNGYIVKVKKNSLPWYNYSCLEAWNDEGNKVALEEVWTSKGTAYHFDCGFNILGEYHGKES